MKIIYRAYDGVEFSDPEACVLYEKSNPPYKMWDSDGETDSFDSALVAEIIDVDSFIKSCKERTIVTDGIHNKGLYFWSCERFEWVWIDRITQQILSSF